MAAESLVVKLGARIRELRERAELTQEQLATKAGISSHYTSAIERGTRAATLETFSAIADAFDLSLSELLAGVDRPLPRDLKRVESALAGRTADEQRTILELVAVALRLGER